MAVQPASWQPGMPLAFDEVLSRSAFAQKPRPSHGRVASGEKRPVAKKSPASPNRRAAGHAKGRAAGRPVSAKQGAKGKRPVTRSAPSRARRPATAALHASPAPRPRTSPRPQPRGRVPRKGLLRRIGLVLAVVVAVIVLAGVVDLATSAGKICRVVSISGLDVGGMTRAEAAQAVEQQLGSRVSGQPVTVYANYAAVTDDTPGEVTSSDAGVTQMEAVLSGSDGSSWSIPARTVGAAIDAEGLADRAYQVGRGASGLSERFSARFGGGVDLPLLATVDDERASELLVALTEVSATPMVDAQVVTDGSKVSVVEGHEGVGTTPEAFSDKLEAAFADQDERSLMLDANAIPQDVTPQEAEAAAAKVRAAIADPVTLSYQDGTWQLTAEELGEWTVVQPQGEGLDKTLVPELDADAALIGLESVVGSVGTAPINASFMLDADGDVQIQNSKDGSGPDFAAAVSQLENLLYGTGGTRSIQLSTSALTPKITADYLRSLGVNAKLSEYQTTFESSEERINNIHQAAAYLNGTVVAPGETFSFNGTVGERTTARGFMAAGAIKDNKVVDEVGGGICQVATTVFNAAYQAGLPIPVRNNHTMYISHYPDGLDAAVSWPDMDLKFTNDTDGAIYLAAIATDDSITVQLWGTRTGRTVSTKKGEWQVGDDFKRLTVKDGTLPSSYKEVTTRGVKGSKITVTRTICEEDGSVRKVDQFESVYLPVNEVTTVGTGS